MSSWLGGLGSGLGQSLGQVGGSLSSFTGQISNFTKDILLESAEEVGDAASELQVSSSRLQELETLYAAQKSEYERLRRINSELEEKLEAAEIQVKQQSVEYRSLLQQKEVEISHLKARQSGLQEEVQKLQHSAHSAQAQASSDAAVLPVTTAATTTTSSSFLHRSTAVHQGFHGDEVDLSDVLWSQQEINRLSSEVHRLEAEVAHWRRVASKLPGVDGNGDQGEVLKMQRMIKELREEMAREVDEHQHELAAVQDAQRQKMSEISKRHREELAEYEERIEELEEQLQKGASVVQKSTTVQDSSKHQELQSTIQSLQEEAELQRKQHRDLLASFEEAEHQKAKLKREKEEATAENKELLQNYSRLQKSVNELQARVQEQEGKSMLKAQLTLAEERHKAGESESVLELSQEVSDLKSQLVQREQALKQAHLDIETLSAELEELDKQNQEATQHLIAVKEQLSLKKTQADAEKSHLQSDLNSSLEQRRTLQLELEAQGEKLSQRAFSLNELHMAKQQLESTVKELREKLCKSQDLGKELRQESSDLKRALQERETELTALCEKLSHSGEQGNVLEEHRKVLETRDKEIQDLRTKLAEVKTSYERAVSEDFELKIENRKLKEESTQALEKIESLEKQIQDGQASLSRMSLEKETRIEALKLEKSQLESELSQTEKRLSEQSKQYQQTVDELTRARSLDASALQTEHERMVKLNQEKDLSIAELKREMEQMVSDHRDTSEMLDITVAGQNQLTELLQEKNTFAETLKAQAIEAQQELEHKFLGATQECDSLRKSVEEKDKQLGAMKEENSHLKEEIDRLRDQQSRPPLLSEPRTLDIITELETEVAQLKAARDQFEEEVQSLRKVSEEQQATALQSQRSLQVLQSELEQARTRHEQSSLNYERLITAKDEEIVRLQSEVEGLSTQGQSQIQSVEILQEDKTQSLNGENGNEKHDLSKVEIEKLVKGIKEKETEINQLNEKNLSLTKQLDQLVVSQNELGKLSQMVLQKDLEIQALHARVSGGHGQDVMFLQQQLQAYAVEREQVLAVLNEKTRENSQLRSDYHRIMDIIAAKEATLLKLQQENQRLSTMSDPSGSQEMFRETIQNLSRIIREKDIEIDALTQKCQTLVSVLQTSGVGDSVSGGSGGVSSNQFEELLQERDTLKQQVKKMEEWKQQVITTVRNMQHESAQLQEELLKLQGQVSADSDCSSQLSVDYSRLIQSYEQKEKTLGLLSQELAQVQQTISQLSSTKDVLLGKLGSVKQSPEASAMMATQAFAPPNLKGAAPPGQDESLNQELQSMQRILAEKESMIRTLQENNHRLSNSASLSENEQRSHAEELKQAREKQESLQRSLREKDLLIKTKGDQLCQVSESLRNRENDNEVLKQAVTNLKERALILELDVKKLKEENEAIAAKAREKETEFRALQETNMQVSLLLREREFQFSAVNEKATAMEKMLKDKEQGKSGELNQLLNEVKSMQEKAVLFQQERDQVMMALKQKQMETTALQSEVLQHTQDKEQRLKQEVERLRNHLLEIEDSYTREALAAEDREGELRRRVALLEERLTSSSNAVESASQQASLQVESLQEQLNGAVRQRDEALIQLRASQDQVNQYAVSLSNLQMVLEQFQQEEKAMYSAELEKHKREKEEWRTKAENIQDQAAALQINLDEANAALESASRLTDQLDLKEEEIEDLKKQGETKCQQEMLEEAQRKLMNLLNSTEGKVDKVLMKNLYLGYFHTPRNKRSEVLRLMGNVLGLDRDEVSELLQEEGKSGVTGWVSSWLGGRAVQSVPNTPQRPTHTQNLNSSFSEMFVKFLQVESTPALPAPKLPVYDIKPLSAPPPGVSGPGKRTGDSNPFLAPRSAAVPLLNPAGSGSTAGAGGHLLMKPISDALPTFTPVPVSAEASGGAVLKDLLKQ
uniref:Thyroid hormone receptor interactor 11 n=1 Tax=Cyprinus carpio carpio TaxID=630221 RepID=A0A9J7X7D1_CYPCA